MTTPSDGLRRDAETTRLLGGRLVLVDGAAVIAKARRERVQLFRTAHFPPPVQSVGFSLERVVEGGREVIRMAADVRTGGFPPPHVIINSAVLGAAGPVSVLLARGLANGGPAAQRIAARAEQVAAAPTKLLRTFWPPVDGSPDSADPLAAAAAVGLHATISYNGAPAGKDNLVGPRAAGANRVVSIRADVLDAEVTPAHLREMAVLMLRVVGELAGTAEPLRGRTYVVSLGGGIPAPAVDRSEEVTLDQVGGLPGVVDQFREIAVSFQHPEIDGPVGRPPAAGHPDVRPARHRQDHAGPGTGQRDRRRLPRDPHPGDPRQVARRLRAQHQADLPGGPALPGAHRDAVRRVRQHHQLRGRRRRRGQPGGQRGRRHLQAGDERPHRGQPERDRRGDHQLPAPGRRLADPLRPLRHQAVDPAARRERPSGDLHAR